VAVDVDRVELLVGNFDAFRLGFGVEAGVHLQAHVGGRASDQVDDDLQAVEQLAAPVGPDEAEQPVLDRVPFTCPRGKVADRDRKAAVVGELLQLGLPQSAWSESEPPSRR